MANLPGSEEISVLIRAILEPAMAGGMPEERAKAIYEDILSSIANLEELEDGRTVFQWLADDILLRFCPIFQDKYNARQKRTKH
ncbi:hypothetical protein [Desulforhabdus amnigena]|jgi:hypothetical protein|uniref:Uncharacterized protein n=1 Tax=Desulforhabdus amnigena TaxID=40218 RepID=A0A9W6FRE6_9BACT|nr:hypothetical protein [Desulforhabdus amnigena]NLJ27253.1 hypothetical protein [Deltaproteobacteria bacterium]GLI32898.1 hypothetical protein DAMNIGENAA_03310 [Desulforhabdus amnigena]